MSDIMTRKLLTVHDAHLYVPGYTVLDENILDAKRTLSNSGLNHLAYSSKSVLQHRISVLDGIDYLISMTDTRNAIYRWEEYVGKFKVDKETYLSMTRNWSSVCRSAVILLKDYCMFESLRSRTDDGTSKLREAVSSVLSELVCPLMYYNITASKERKAMLASTVSSIKPMSDSCKNMVCSLEDALIRYDIYLWKIQTNGFTAEREVLSNTDQCEVDSVLKYFSNLSCNSVKEFDDFTTDNIALIACSILGNDSLFERTAARATYAVKLFECVKQVYSSYNTDSEYDDAIGFLYLSVTKFCEGTEFAWAGDDKQFCIFLISCQRLLLYYRNVWNSRLEYKYSLDDCRVRSKLSACNTYYNQYMVKETASDSTSSSVKSALHYISKAVSVSLEAFNSAARKSRNT